MKIYKCIFVCMLSLLLSACIGGILVNGGGDVGAPALQVFPGNAQTFTIWTPDPDNPGDNYELNRGEEEVFDGTATNYNDSPLTNGTRVCYTVTAVTGTERATSDQACATPMADITLAITNQSLQAFLQWTEVEGAVSYNLYSLISSPSLSLPKDTDKANGDGGTLIANVVGPPFEYAWTDLSNCETYPVKVVPVDIDGKESVADVSYIDAEPTTGGYLDTIFGTNGVVLESGLIGQFYDVKLLSDGRIAAIQNNAAISSNLYIYNNDGSLNDIIDLLGDPDIDMSRARTLAIDEDDNIYVAGQDDDMRICKLDSAGALDTSFGQILTNAGCYRRGGINNSVANDIVIHSSGDLIMTGQVETVADLEFAVWRMTSDGVLDWEYTYTTLGDDYMGEAITVQGDSIIAVGAETTPIEELVVVSLDLDGNLQGVDLDSGATAAWGYGVASAPDGSVVVTGLTATGALARFLPIWNYATDATLLDYNVYTLTAGAGNGSTGFDIQYDCRDRIVATGLDLNVSGRSIVMRTDDTFNIDTSFGNIDPLNGWFLYDAGVTDFGYTMTQDDLGRIYVAGTEDDGANFRPILMRLQ